MTTPSYSRNYVGYLSQGLKIAGHKYSLSNLPELEHHYKCKRIQLISQWLSDVISVAERTLRWNRATNSLLTRNNLNVSNFTTFSTLKYFFFFETDFNNLSFVVFLRLWEQLSCQAMWWNSSLYFFICIVSLRNSFSPYP